MLNDKDFPQQLRDAETAEEIVDLMRYREREVIKDSI